MSGQRSEGQVLRSGKAEMGEGWPVPGLQAATAPCQASVPPSGLPVPSPAVDQKLATREESGTLLGVL